MPFEVVKVPRGFKVQDIHGNYYSKKPLTKKTAISQQKALYASEARKHHISGNGFSSYTDDAGSHHILLNGNGWFSDVWTKVKAVANDVTTALGNVIATPILQTAADVSSLGVRQDYPPKVRDILARYGDGTVEALQIVREPINSLIDKALQIITLGKWGQAKEDLKYDNLFHLSMVASLSMPDGGKVRIKIEKNDVINMDVIASGGSNIVMKKRAYLKEHKHLIGLLNDISTKAKKEAQDQAMEVKSRKGKGKVKGKGKKCINNVSGGCGMCGGAVGDINSINVPVPCCITLQQMMDKAQAMMGASFFRYDAFNNNCQIFLASILKANGLMTPEIETFILQDVQTLLKSLPKYTNPLANTITNIAGATNRFLFGEGFNQEMFDKLQKSITPKAKWEASRKKTNAYRESNGLPALTETYEEWRAKVEAENRKRSTTSDEARQADWKQQEQQMQGLKERNEAYAQKVAENPDLQDVVCEYDMNGNRNKTRTTKGQCRLNHQEWEKQKHPENYYIFRPAVNAAANANTWLAENVPGVPPILRDVAKKASEYALQNNSLTGGSQDRAVILNNKYESYKNILQAISPAIGEREYESGREALEHNYSNAMRELQNNPDEEARTGIVRMFTRDAYNVLLQLVDLIGPSQDNWANLDLQNLEADERDLLQGAREEVGDVISGGGPYKNELKYVYKLYYKLIKQLKPLYDSRYEYNADKAVLTHKYNEAYESMEIYNKNRPVKERFLNDFRNFAYDFILHKIREDPDRFIDHIDDFHLGELNDFQLDVLNRMLNQIADGDNQVQEPIIERPLPEGTVFVMNPDNDISLGIPEIPREEEGAASATSPGVTSGSGRHKNMLNDIRNTYLHLYQTVLPDFEENNVEGEYNDLYNVARDSITAAKRNPALKLQILNEFNRRSYNGLVNQLYNNDRGIVNEVFLQFNNEGFDLTELESNILDTAFQYLGDRYAEEDEAEAILLEQEAEAILLEQEAEALALEQEAEALALEEEANRTISDAGSIDEIVSDDDIPMEGGSISNIGPLFRRQLEKNKITPEEYLEAARRLAKSHNYDPSRLEFSDDGNHKLMMTDDTGNKRHFGAVEYGDYILWLKQEELGNVKEKFAEQKRRQFVRSHSKIRGDWKKDKYSPNNLALRILWDS